MKISLTDTSNLFFSADPHFFHANMLKYGRPWDTVEEMNETIITNWNNKVPKDAIVFLVGDFAMASKTKTHETLSKLNGKFYYIFGNHDTNKYFDHEKIIKSGNYCELKIGDIFIVLSHFPFEVWNKRQYQSWHIHGHCHGSLVLANDTQKRMDVGIDCHKNFEPFSFDEVEEFMKDRYNVKKDHHDKTKISKTNRFLKKLGIQLIKWSER